MSLTSKSPRTVVLAALAVGKGAYADYSHPNSPRKYTQPQLFACLVLMTFLRTDYRGVEEHLKDLPAYREWLGLEHVPDHSTLHKAVPRLLGHTLAIKAVHSTIRMTLGEHPRIKKAAADSSGLESGHRSPYFVKRRQRGQKSAQNPLFQTTTYTRFPKLSTLVDCNTHLVLSMLSGTGPSPDMHDLPALLADVPANVTLLKLLADAGYDSQANHQYLREEHGIQSLIPAQIGRPTSKPPSGHWRRLMRRLLGTPQSRQRSGYSQRWQVETVYSMIKRNLGDELASRSYHAQCREQRLMVITHNVMILLVFIEVFDRALPTPLSSPRGRLSIPPVYPNRRRRRINQRLPTPFRRPALTRSATAVAPFCLRIQLLKWFPFA
ncbi:MAG: IS5 family transposase [Phycisphaeraceae bacterium]